MPRGTLEGEKGKILETRIAESAAIMVQKQGLAGEAGEKPGIGFPIDMNFYCLSNSL
jgi:hypothetical protein